MAAAIKTPPVQYDTFQMAGGVDLVTPTIELKPGVARSAVNFEISTSGGYTRIPGYERFDGHASPSAATYAVMTLSSVVGLAVGNAFTDTTSSATGTVLAIDANNNVVYGVAAGVISLGDTIKVGGTTIGTTVVTTNFAPTAQTQATYTWLASNAQRALIGMVPGAGPVRGVANYNGTVYAWRNNVGNSAMAIYKSSAAGWVLVPLGYQISYTAGVATGFPEGSTVYGATSGATGVVARVANQTSTVWVASSGRLILSSVTGTFVNGESLKLTNTSGVIQATAGSAATAITLQPNGKVEIYQGTFGSNVATRMYGADGVNNGFEFDGTVYVPILTGMVADTPSHVVLSKNYLYFSFGASTQQSGIGLPYVWSPVLGANEFLLPEVVTAYLVLPGTTNSGSLAIFSAKNTFLLYGTNSSTWNLTPYNTGLGAAAYTAQITENVFTLGDRGVNMSESTQAYGNFNSSVLTLNLRPFTQARRLLSTCSGVNREKSQYRVFYSDGYGLYTTIVNGQVSGSMPVLFPDPVNVWCAGTPVDGPETSYFGGNLGYVYTLDVGTSFDGAAISANFTLNFNAEGSVRMLKRYRRASLEVNGLGYADFAFGYALGYGTTAIQQAGATQYTSPFAQTNWDSFTWDSFIWDGSTLAPSEVECTGTGENIAVTITTSSAIDTSFTVNSITLHYSQRRGIR